MKHARTVVQLLLSASLLAAYAACSDEELEPARQFSDGGTTDGSSVGPLPDGGGSTDTDSSMPGTDASVPTDASPPKDSGPKKDAGHDAADAGDASDASDASTGGDTGAVTDAADDVVDAADDSG